MNSEQKLVEIIMQKEIREALSERTVSEIEEYHGCALFNMKFELLALIYSMIKYRG